MTTPGLLPEGAWRLALQRETAAHVLAGGQACPVYALPHWVCSTLHLITGVCRTVTTGRFERLGAALQEVDEGGVYRPWIAHHPCCPHGGFVPGLPYWSTPAASTLDSAQQARQGGP